MQVLNPAAIRDGATYRIVFNATGAVPKYTTSSYSVVRVPSTSLADTLQMNVSAAQFGTSIFSSPFDGIAFSFMNDTSVVIDDTASGWVVGQPGVIIRASKDNLNASRDVAWPADYELRWYAGTADTAAFNLPPRFPQMPVNFRITNITSGQRVKFIVDDANRDGVLSFGDTIRVIDGYVGPTNYSLTYKLIWDRGFGLSPTPIADGDRYILRTRRPFAQGDYFEFTTRAAHTDPDSAKKQLSKIGVVPNPYISTANWERRTLFTTGRGDRRIEFTHLPAQCTLRIYTVSGHLVKTLVKDSNAADGSLAWDLISDDGMDIAYGLYIYHVKADFGEQVGKFAVIK